VLFLTVVDELCKGYILIQFGAATNVVGTDEPAIVTETETAG